MGHKTLIGGTAYDIKGGKTLIGGTGYDIKKGRTLIGGTGYDISFGTPLGELAVKTSVYMNVDGVRTEWKVAHQGIPDATIYDDSCNGTWLLMKDIYEEREWASSSVYYANSSTHSYLNETFLGLLDSNIQAAVKQVNLPCFIVEYGKRYISPLSTKIFLLSGYECGWTTSDDGNFPVEGAKLSCFDSSSSGNSGRIAYYNGTATGWWLRSRYTNTLYTLTWYVTSNGGCSNVLYSKTKGVRPALVLDPEETLVDGDFNIMIA